MDGKDFESVMRELDEVTREMSRVQEDIHREIAEKITSIQRMIEGIPPDSLDKVPQEQHVREEVPKEVIIEENRIVIRQGGKTIYEGLY